MKPRGADGSAPVPDMLSDAREWSEPVAAAEPLTFLREGIQRRQLRRLQRGYFPTSAEIDLHGLTAEHARERLSAFLAQCTQQGHRCVRIVHGKGHRSPDARPVIKTLVNRWLRMRSEVLAFCSAAPREGGTGALRVLLRTGKELHTPPRG